MGVFWGRVVGGGGMKSSLLSKFRVFNWSLGQMTDKTLHNTTARRYMLRSTRWSRSTATTSVNVRAKHSRRTQREIVQRVVKQQYSKPLLQADSSVQITRTVRVRCTAANVFHCNGPFAWETVYVLSSEQRVLREQVGCRVMVHRYCTRCIAELITETAAGERSLRTAQYAAGGLAQLTH